MLEILVTPVKKYFLLQKIINIKQEIIIIYNNNKNLKILLLKLIKKLPSWH